MSQIPSWKVEEPFLELGGSLLEGPSYDAKSDELRWVDILKEQVWLLKLSEGRQSLRSFDLKGNVVTTLMNIKGVDNLLLVGAKYGFATLNTVTGELSYFRKYFDQNDASTNAYRFRANDGAVDAKGRILQGFMIDDTVEEVKPEGMLLLLGLDGSMHRLIEHVGCPNGLGWNATNKIMYWAESRSGNVYAFDYDIDTGMASGQRVFFHLDPMNNTNAPDGLVVDEEDHIWLAVWGGSKVLRISPHGIVVATVQLPTRFVTCPLFVGTDLFITTAAETDPATFPQSAKAGGHLYKVDVGVKGLPKFESFHPDSYTSTKRTAS